MPRTGIVRALRAAVAPRAACLLVVATALGHAALAPANEKIASLADLSLEQLADIVVTSVSRREQRLAEAPASVYVITADDIRRSGVRSLPEALRLAPNLQIARADANQYAITARGFGNVLANKLLVMIDGRTIYSPLFSGVFWEAHDVMLENVERIEVISGPESTLWGTNAVNGVINVITKTAKSTQGALVAAGGGNRDWSAATRYGGEAAGGHYRLYARVLGLEDTERANGTSVDDAARRARIGFRYDGGDATDQFSVIADAYTGEIDQPAGQRDIAGGNALVRWRRTLASGAIVDVQAYWDRTKLDQGTFREDLDTFDVDAQARFAAGARNTLIAGGGYRLQRDRTGNGTGQAFIPADRNLDTGYLFVQDEYEASDSLALIGGIKVEHNEYTGAEVLPNVRVRWQPLSDLMLWTAASRAVRSPARVDRELFAPGQPPFLLNGGPDFEAEVANVYEIGVRGRVAPRMSYSLTFFHHDWDRLRSLEPAQGGGLAFANGIEGTTSGVEAWATWQPTDGWRLSAGGTLLRQRLHPRPGVVDLGGLAALGNDPKRNFVLRSSHDLPHGHELDVIVRHVGERPNPVVPAYTALDLRWGWHVNDRVEVSLTLENLTDTRHPEWGVPANRVEFERAFFAGLSVRL
jgi:iron complex outermembrane receptor protein